MLNVSILLATGIYSSIIVLGWIVFRNNPKNISHRLFLMFCATFSFWLFANFFQIWTTDPYFARLFLLADFAIAPFFCLYLFLFLFSFPKRSRIITPLGLGLSHIPVIAASLLVFLGLVINSIEKIGHKITFSESSWFMYYALVVIVFMFGGMVHQILLLRSFSDTQKKQVKIMLSGFIPTFLILCIGNLFFQNTIPPEWFVMVNFSSLILVSSITVAILYYRFLGIKSVFQNSLVFWTLFLLVVSFSYTIHFLHQTAIAPEINIAALSILSVLFVPLFLHVLKNITIIAERVFSTKVDVKKVLRSTLDSVNACTDTDSFTKKLQSDLDLIFSSETAVIFFDAPNDDLQYPLDEIRTLAEEANEQIFYEDYKYRSMVPHGRHEKSVEFLMEYNIAIVSPIFDKEHAIRGVIIVPFDPNKNSHEPEEKSYITLLGPQLVGVVSRILK